MVSRDELPGFLPSSQMLVVKEVFAVPLDVADAENIVTVGQLFEHIVANFSSAEQEGCLRSIAFYQLRRALMKCGVSRDEVNVNAWLSSLLPKEQRNLHWAKLRNELALPLPNLRYSNRVEFCLGMLAVIAVFLIFLAFAVSKQPIWSICAGIVAAAIIFAIKWLDRTRDKNYLAVEIPAGFETVGRAVEQIVTWNYAEMAQRSGNWSREELFMALKNVIAFLCSAEPGEITVDTKFIDLPDFE